MTLPSISLSQGPGSEGWLRFGFRRKKKEGKWDVGSWEVVGSQTRAAASQCKRRGGGRDVAMDGYVGRRLSQSGAVMAGNGAWSSSCSFSHLEKPSWPDRQILFFFKPPRHRDQIYVPTAFIIKRARISSDFTWNSRRKCFLPDNFIYLSLWLKPLILKSAISSGGCAV